MKTDFIYTLTQDIKNTSVWYFSLYPSKDSKSILLIKVNADTGRFTLSKSANLNLKIVYDCITKLLEFLRTLS